MALPWESKARFRSRSTHVPNLIDELSPAKERRLNQFGTTVLIRCGNVVKFDKVCRSIRHWSSKAQFKRRTSHVPNLMQMSENNGFFSFALDSAHVKFDV